MAKRPNWDSRPIFHVIIQRADGTEYVLESYPDEGRALERAELLRRHLENCTDVRVSMDHAANTHRRGPCSAS